MLENIINWFREKFKNNNNSNTDLIYLNWSDLSSSNDTWSDCDSWSDWWCDGWGCWWD